MSNWLVREPLNGREAVLPVPDSIRHWFASPRAAVGFLCRAAEIDGNALQGRRCLTMPGVSATVADEIEALRRAAGEDAVRLIRRRRLFDECHMPPSRRAERDGVVVLHARE